MMAGLLQESSLGSINKKLLSHLADFDHKGERELSESIRKGKSMTKIFFSNDVEWSSKNLWQMISADVKANKNNK